MRNCAFVSYHEFELEVEYDYTPEEGDNWNSPHFPEEAEITSAKVFGQEILQHLSEEMLNRLRTEALEDIAAEREQALMDRAEAEWERRNEYDYAA